MRAMNIKKRSGLRSRVAACSARRWIAQLGPSSGSFHFDGSDPMGAFSGEVSAYTCTGRFVGESLQVMFGGDTRKWISLEGRGDGPARKGDDERWISVVVRGVERKLFPSRGTTFDVRQWLDDDKQVHAHARVDCTSERGRRACAGERVVERLLRPAAEIGAEARIWDRARETTT